MADEKKEEKTRCFNKASGDFIVEFVRKRTALADHRVFGTSAVEDSLEVSLQLK
ncbi:hypothetical protein KIN20_008181 [Parelaphostrongylus tenuis]|uniref:Uncharacterized protein n=1 Tax=Parelaphostrongylus tenuis TaxID=148309 RepID=A0AAD5MMF9_PARTN|nr:hypothetical protein KIN20_008181 [Parelaphostrongylus tenuis]